MNAPMNMNVCPSENLIFINIFCKVGNIIPFPIVRYFEDQGTDMAWPEPGPKHRVAIANIKIRDDQYTLSDQKYPDTYSKL
jgi:hypothetical protein